MTCMIMPDGLKKIALFSSILVMRPWNVPRIMDTPSIHILYFVFFMVKEIEKADFVLKKHIMQSLRNIEKIVKMDFKISIVHLIIILLKIIVIFSVCWTNFGFHHQRL